MKTIFPFLIFSLVTYFQLQAQHFGINIQTAKNQGITVSHLDSIYQSALHSDVSLAVFKTDEEQEKMLNAYTKFIQDWGNFLQTNGFKWEKLTKSWNRIYFNTDGSVDYFLYTFQETEKLTKEQQKEFDRLLNEFIKTAKISITANVKFAQCSPVIYQSKKEE